jgi:hypothetical protein
MTELRKDIIGRRVNIGDMICWNPAKYKGLVFGIITGFRKANGLPIVLIDNKFSNYYIGQNSGEIHHYVPKTGFALIKEL